MRNLEKAKGCQLELMMGNLISMVASVVPPTCGISNMSHDRIKVSYTQPLNFFTLNIGLSGESILIV